MAARLCHEHSYLCRLISPERVVLLGCQYSRWKPLCDVSHRRPCLLTSVPCGQRQKQSSPKRSRKHSVSDHSAPAHAVANANRNAIMRFQTVATASRAGSAAKLFPSMSSPETICCSELVDTFSSAGGSKKRVFELKFQRLGVRTESTTNYWTVSDATLLCRRSLRWLGSLLPMLWLCSVLPLLSRSQTEYTTAAAIDNRVQQACLCRTSKHTRSQVQLQRLSTSVRNPMP